MNVFTEWLYKDQTKENLIDSLVLWTCEDECRYECSWQTVSFFIKQGWAVPQFHGRWQFTRIFSMQEPASVFFSIFNLWAHWRGLNKFRRNVSSTAPYFYMWQIFAGICLNAWLWSAIFHTRDTFLTELLDYSCAYSMVISSFYCMVCRVALHRRPLWLKGLFGVVVFTFFIYHFVHLLTTKSYGYNMKINIATGSTAGVGWLVWYLNQKRRRAYVWKIATFVILSALSLSLEVLDFPPFMWILDAHALWHLTTAPLALLLWSFIVDDTKALLEEKLNDKKKLP